MGGGLMSRPIPTLSVEIVKDFEGFVADQYIDTGGIPTIGYGHTAAMHDGVLPATCTPSEAEQWLVEDMFESSVAVEKMVNVHMSENQFGALISLCFNIGQGKLSKDSIITKLNNYDYVGAANDFWMWRRDKAPSRGGVILRGLQERRSAECHYFITGTYYGRLTEVYKTGHRLFYGPLS